jgi:hypothetical protein
MSEQEQRLSHIARVIIPNQERQGQLRSLLDDRYAESDIYFWDAEISNNLLDSHYTSMSVKTLENYVEDAARGVAFLRSHNWRELPVGYSVEASLSEVNGRKRVVAGFYTIRGLSDADDLIKRMEAKIVRDVSVGFHGGRMICDLCGQDFWDCRHYPGLKYETKEGDTVKTELATFTIDDARLSETSAVFDGSTPNAMILKAQRAAKAGNLTAEQIGLLEQRYRVALPVSKRFATVEIPKETGKMTEEQEVKVRAVLKLAPEAEIVPAVEGLQKRIGELEPQAEEGRQYRKDLVAEALAEGVRAHGNDFDTESYTGILNSAPLATVKRMRDDWKKTANKVLPAGRASLDEEVNQPKEPVTKKSYVPDEAYAA